MPSVRAVQALTTPVQIIAVLGPNPAQREAVLALIERYQRIKPEYHAELRQP